MPKRGDWKRLGTLLFERRHDLGYESREAFAEEKGFRSSRVLSDIENAKRINFSRGMLLEIEDAYLWERGSIASVLEGHDPVPVETAMAVVVRDARPAPAQLRRRVKSRIDQLTDAQVARVDAYLDGLVNESQRES